MQTKIDKLSPSSFGEYQEWLENYRYGRALIDTSRIIYANKKLLDLLGYTYNELNKRINFLLSKVHPDDVQWVVKKWAEIFNDDSINFRSFNNLRWIKKSGDIIYLNIFIRRVYYKGIESSLWVVRKAKIKKNSNVDFVRSEISLKYVPTEQEILIILDGFKNGMNCFCEFKKNVRPYKKDLKNITDQLKSFLEERKQIKALDQK